MSKQQEPLRVELRSLLARGGRQVTSLNSDGKAVPVPDEAELFQFDFIKDGENYGKVYVTIDGLHQLVVYFDDKVARSPKNGSTDSESWEQLIRTLKRFATQKQLSFQLSNQDNLENDMAKREYTKRQEKVYEGYHPMGKKASYNDSVPTTKMIIKHTRNIEEGEQRYRNVEKIFIENADGERFLAPTTRPGIARVYARHVAEGGKPNDERWNHINGLCEEYNKMAGFVRATRNGQFNESAQRLVTEGVAHYQKLRECLGKMAGKKGYNNYFESWTPSLMEDEEQVDLSEMFMSSSLDPRIESVMPILGKLSKNLGEAKDMAETIALEAWADSLMDGKMGQAALDNNSDDDYIDPEEADYGDEYQDTVKRAGEFVKGVDQRAAARKAYKEKEKGVAEDAHGSMNFMDIVDATDGDIRGIAKKLQNIGLHSEIIQFCYWAREQGIADIFDAIKLAKRVGLETDDENEMAYEGYLLASELLGMEDLDEGNPIDHDFYRKQQERQNKAKQRQGMEENLDANQKAAGQLGPTEKVGKGGPRGKLVGAMESTDPLASILRLIK